MYTLTLTAAEFEQLTVDIEQAREELEELSSEVEWFVSESPERLTTLLDIIRRAVPDEHQTALRVRVAAELLKPHSEAFKPRRRR